MPQVDARVPSSWVRLNALFSLIADRTVLYRRGDVILVTFGAFVASGSLIWMVVTASSLIVHGLSDSQVSFFLAGAGLSALIGSHLFWWLGHTRSMLRQPLFGARHVGFVSWGGLAGAVAFTAAFSRTTGYPMLSASDAVMRGMFAAYAVGRLGCLTYGCCYGRPSDHGGILYRNPASKVVRERGECPAPRHPTPVYSSALGVLLFVLLNTLPSYDVPAGAVTAVGCLVYPLGRAWVEALRDRRRYVRLFTSGHLACLLMFVAGCVLLATASADNHAPRPVPLTAASLAEGLSVAPTILAVSLIVLLATGFHWKRVGTW
jgi:prolipoprotein diacylglyceryltransferase